MLQARGTGLFFLGNVAGSPPAAAGTLASWAEEPALCQPSLQHPNKPSTDYKSNNSPDTVKYSPKYYKTLLSLSPYMLPSCHQLQGPVLDCSKNLINFPTLSQSWSYCSPRHPGWFPESYGQVKNKLMV